jgi:DNA-binding transcriptional regulator YiaG
MNDETFAELMRRLKEGAKILYGKLPPASEFVHTITDVKAIHENIGLYQQEFANLLCISKRTLEGWEQGQKKLTG